MLETRSYRIGIDIGGTFTDIVALEEQSGHLHVCKVPTVTADPSKGFMNGLELAIQQFKILPEAIRYLVHGTTVATNTIIEGKGARVGLITSEGFSDVLEIAYQIRPSVYDVFYDKTPPLIPRYLCRGVPERLDSDGNVLVPLDTNALHKAAMELKALGAEALVVAFLHSYRNPSHERRAGSLLTDAELGIPVVISSDICAEFREYPRTSTAVVNAVLLPKVGSYISRLQKRLKERGIQTDLHLMTSAGGCLSSALARAQPVHLIESGPAAGVIGATFIAGLAGHRDLLALDMGGTTTKVAVVSGGVPRVADQFEVGSTAVASNTANRGRGYPVRTPVLEIIEIGAGGGSIGHVDPGGSLSVGPESMGADPGPACYGLGGERPTLTDANVVLGRLPGDFLLGGDLPIQREKSIQAIEAYIASPLRMSVAEAANALVEIGVSKMAAALYLVSVRRGIDPRDHILVATGGAGPLHAALIARQLNIPRLLIPRSPGLNSALGLLATDLKHEFTRTVMMRTEAANWKEVDSYFIEMENRARGMLIAEGVPDYLIECKREVDMCYLGQAYQLRIPVISKSLDDSASEIMVSAFHSAHHAAYAFANEGERTQIVNLRVTAIGKVARPEIREVTAGTSDLSGALKGSRQVHFSDHAGYVTCPLYDRSKLQGGAQLSGPAIIEQMDTTTLIPPDTFVEVDNFGNLVLSLNESVVQ